MTEHEEEQQKSRSQIKREFDELRELVRELVEMPEGHLTHVPLSERTSAALNEARRLSRAPLKRQIRYIVRLMDAEDVGAIRDALNGASQLDVVEEPSQLELWCEELVAGSDDDVYEFAQQHPRVDFQRLRQLVRAARSERDAGQSKGVQPLLDYVRTVVDLA